jgi:hypothetical protein
MYFGLECKFLRLSWYPECICELYLPVVNQLTKLNYQKFLGCAAFNLSTWRCIIIIAQYG